MMKKTTLTIAFIAFASSLMLSGCGIKPKDVDPPPGAENINFPQTYPDPSTDAQP